MTEKYDLRTLEGVEAAERNLAEVHAAYEQAERNTGLLWSLIIGRQAHLIAEARERLEQAA